VPVLRDEHRRQGDPLPALHVGIKPGGFGLTITSGRAETAPRRRASFAMMLHLVVAALLAAAPLAAQTRPQRKPGAAQQQAWPLISLAIKGNKFYSDQQIIAASGLRIGAAVSKPDFDQARDRLLATGAFASVAYEFAPAPNGKGYSGVFEVSEIEQRYPYRFERLPAPDAELRALIKQRQPLFGDEIPATERVLNQLAAAVQDYVAARGFQDKVIARTVSNRSGELNIVFRSATPAPSVSEVNFTGNQVVPKPILQRAFSEIAVGAPYSETTIRELLNTTVRPLYEARGRLRVSFPKIQAEKSSGDVEGVPITIQVEEGPAFNFGKITAQSAAVPNSEVLALAKLKSGALANFDEVKAALDRIRDRFHRDGYMRAEVAAERHINDDAKTVDVVIRTTPGPQFRMGKLEIKGLDIVSEPAVRKLWAMNEGKPYNASYPRFFLDRIQSGGYFDNLRSTRFEQHVNEEAHTVDVTLYFQGGAPSKQPNAQPPAPEPSPHGGMGGGWPPW
jgi:outer membrane protein insertion porin family